jgi:hypothetical protein
LAKITKFAVPIKNQTACLNMHKFNILEASHQEDYRIFFTFDDGAKGAIDLKDFLFSENCGLFKRLQNIQEFKNFLIINHAIVWGDDLDLAPEFLYDLLVKKVAAHQ